MAGKLFLIVGFAASVAFGWLAFPHILYQSAEQPLQFSHKVHTGAAAMQCVDCHSVRADGRFSGIPPLETCAGCHAAAIGATTDEKVLVDRYVAANREIPWRVYARQPDNVYFSHATHLKLAKLDCVRCHGEHGKTDRLRAYEFNPITGYGRDIGEPKFLRAGLRSASPSMKMDDCAACHRDRGVKTACLDCHK